MTQLNLKKIGVHLGLIFASCWGLIFVFFACGGKVNSAIFLPVAIVYMCIPGLASFVVQKYFFFEPVDETLGITFKFNRWYLIAWLVPPFFAMIVLGTNMLMPGVSMSMSVSDFQEKLFQVIFIATAFTLPFAFCEELAWRGLLQRELEAVGFWKSAFLVGFVWAVWHYPLILAGYNYPQHPLVGVPLFTLVCVLLSPLLSYLRIKGGSVFVPSIGHAAFNACAVIASFGITGGSDITVGACGLSSIIILTLLNAILATRKIWGAQTVIEPGKL